jgi:hypothetical protein
VLVPDYHNIAPRLGMAYSIDSKTVIRSSYGIFFDTFGVNYAQTQQGTSRQLALRVSEIRFWIECHHTECIYPEPVSRAGGGIADTARLPAVPQRLAWYNICGGQMKTEWRNNTCLSLAKMYYSKDNVVAERFLTEGSRALPRPRSECPRPASPATFDTTVPTLAGSPCLVAVR